MAKEQTVYTKEFREEAVRLAQTSGKPIAQIARELGISDSAIHGWRKELAEHGKEAFPGKGHPMLVPYQAFETHSRRIIIAAGNDRLYRDLCYVLGLEELATDPRFHTNALRVQHRADLLPLLQTALLVRDAEVRLAALQQSRVGPDRGRDVS